MSHRDFYRHCGISLYLLRPQVDLRHLPQPPGFVLLESVRECDEVSVVYAGCVFFAFGLSLVDSGGLLGRPLKQYSLAACLPKDTGRVGIESKLVLPTHKAPHKIDDAVCSTPLNGLQKSRSLPISQMA